MMRCGPLIALVVFGKRSSNSVGKSLSNLIRSGLSALNKLTPDMDGHDTVDMKLTKRTGWAATLFNFTKVGRPRFSYSNVQHKKKISCSPSLLFLLSTACIVVSFLLHDCLPIPRQVLLQRVDVLVEAQGAHSPQNIIAVDSLPLLTLAFVACLGRDKAHKLTHAFLNGVLPVLGHLRVCRKCFLFIQKGNSISQIPGQFGIQRETSVEHRSFCLRESQDETCLTLIYSPS